MKKYFLTYIFLLSIVASAQTWSALGSGIDTASSAAVYCMTMFNGELYVGGLFSKAGGVPANNIAKWNGSTWSAVGTGTSSYVYALCVYKNELYAGGIFVYADGKQVNEIAKWNGTSWDTVGTGTDSSGVYALCVYNGELYAGGDFIKAGGVSSPSIAKWNGTNWSGVGGGLTGGNYNGWVMALTNYNGKLYATGDFSTANSILGYYNVAQWNGTNWDTLSTGLSGGSMVEFYSISGFNGEVYVGSAINNMTSCVPSGLGRIPKWNGTCWDSVGAGIIGGAIFALTEYNGSLYAGGGFSLAGGNPVKSIAKWNDTNWSSVGSGLDSGGVWCFAIDTATGSLYVGGSFLFAGGISANKIAKWTMPNGINENNFSSQINIFPNPTTGLFTITSTEKISSIKITNIIGEEIVTSAINHQTSTIDLSNYAKGIYFIKLLSEKGIETKKIILQ
ncbi:MAG: T9SS type A sorting domain-containing protein [Bacteroidetes bacterium]|nr:T9SS type A sorting domain-containing protein [Bacteroidota bacterium]